MPARNNASRPITNLRSRVAGAVAGVAMAAAGIACTQSMPVTDELRMKLATHFAGDIRHLSILIGKELEFWINPPWLIQPSF